MKSKKNRIEILKYVWEMPGFEVFNSVLPKHLLYVKTIQMKSAIFVQLRIQE